MMGLHDLQYTFDALVARWVENPYDGHTPAATLAATEKLTGVAVTDAYVDKGYRGHGYTGGADAINAVLAAA